MSFNILTEFKLTTLHLYIDNIADLHTPSFEDIIYNMILPFMILYITLGCLKKALSLREFYIDEKVKIKNIYKKYSSRKAKLS